MISASLCGAGAHSHKLYCLLRSLHSPNAIALHVKFLSPCPTHGQGKWPLSKGFLTKSIPAMAPHSANNLRNQPKRIARQARAPHTEAGAPLATARLSGMLFADANRHHLVGKALPSRMVPRASQEKGRRALRV